MAWNIFKSKKKEVLSSATLIKGDSENKTTEWFLSGEKVTQKTKPIERVDFHEMNDEIIDLKIKLQDSNERVNKLTAQLSFHTTPKKELKDNSVEEKIKAVKSHLFTVGNITSLEAIKLFGYTRLSDGIFNLKKQGLDIYTTPEHHGKSNIVRYHLRKAN